MGFLVQVNPESLLRQAQDGNRSSRDTLICKYTPFIIKTASSVCGRYLRMGEDDEVSVSLIAFDEAIDKYDKTRGVAFLTFAQRVIQRRLIDHFRREGKANRAIPVSELVDPDNESHGLAVVDAKQATGLFREQQTVEARRDEIERFQVKLRDYGLSFQILTEVSPKHRDARQAAMEVARLIATDELLTAHLRKRKELPMKELETRARVSRKTLERQRRYILAIALVLIDDYPYLSEYIKNK
ncbi:MAG: RNA polymerase sigma-I factor [Bacillota bacterium]